MRRSAFNFGVHLLILPNTMALNEHSIFQVAKNLVPPVITLCNYQQLSVAIRWSTLRTESEKKADPLQNRTADALYAYNAIYKHLQGMYFWAKTNIYPGNMWPNHRMVQKLNLARDSLMSNELKFALLDNLEWITFKEIFDEIGPHFDDTIRYCSHAGVPCTNITQMQRGQFSKCFKYDMGQQTSGEGTQSAVTIIFMTGGKLGSVLLDRNLKGKLIGFMNTYSPTSADGMRIMLSVPGDHPDTYGAGFNVGARFSTFLAVTGKETIRKPWPYSDCTAINYEMQLLRTEVAKVYENETDIYDEDLDSTYTEQQCRFACLQRHIFQKCHCIGYEMKHIFPNVSRSIFCGSLDKNETHMFLYPEQYNKSDCFEFFSVVLHTDHCNFVIKMLDALACVKNVKEEFTKTQSTNASPCQCPPACYSYDYIVSTSQSPWPSPGEETNAAYLEMWVGGYHLDGATGSTRYD